MSQRDGGVNRQHSVETGLTQAIGPMLICASESSVSVRNQQVGLHCFTYFSLTSKSAANFIVLVIPKDCFKLGADGSTSNNIC